MDTTAQKLIGLLLGGRILTFDNAVMMGVIRYARRMDTWRFDSNGYLALEMDGQHETTGAYLNSFSGDGIITIYGDKTTLERLAARVPVVSLGNYVEQSKVCCVMNDDVATGALGAEHLMSLGDRHYAFVRLTDFAYSRQREAGFRGAMQAAGHDFSTHALTGFDFTDLTPLTTLLRSLKLPVAIMTEADRSAFPLLTACRQANLRVPQDVAILGVDNFEMMCEMNTPTLSSIVRDGERMGWEAARLLDRLIQGKPIKERTLLIPPAGVVQRTSTSETYAADEAVDTAMQYISQHAAQKISVADVVRVVSVSRRTLETRFADLLGKTIQQEIRSTHVRRAKELLKHTNSTIARIAIESGFTDRSQLNIAFCAEVNMTPTEYRASVQ